MSLPLVPTSAYIATLPLGPNQIIAGPANVTWATPSVAKDIIFVPSIEFTLLPGHLYQLEATLVPVGAVTAVARFDWVDNADSSFADWEVSAQLPTTSIAAATAIAWFRPLISTDVHLRQTNGAGSLTLSATYSSVRITTLE